MAPRCLPGDAVLDQGDFAREIHPFMIQETHCSANLRWQDITGEHLLGIIHSQAHFAFPISVLFLLTPLPYFTAHIINSSSQPCAMKPSSRRKQPPRLSVSIPRVPFFSAAIAYVVVLCMPEAAPFVVPRPATPPLLVPQVTPVRVKRASASTPFSSSMRRQAHTVYSPPGWDREMYRPPDDVLFEWQELVCCLKFMEEKEVNAGMLAPETRDMMIGYADALIAGGSPVRTLEGLAEAMMGRWKLAFTTEERYKILPPGTRVYYHIHRDGRLENVMKFKDKYWDSLISSATYNLTPQGRLLFEFSSNRVNINNPFQARAQWKIPLPPNVGNTGSAFADVSYMDGVLWIEKIRDPGTEQVFVTIYEYQGPIEGEERTPSTSLSLSSPPSSSSASSTGSLIAFLEGLEKEEQEELAEERRKEGEREGETSPPPADPSASGNPSVAPSSPPPSPSSSSSSPSSRVSA